MSLIVILFVAGVLLLALEVIVPGGVLGIVGGVLIFIGVLVAFSRYGFDGGLIASGVAAGLTALALYIEFVVLPKTQLAKKFSMTATVAGTSQPPVAERKAVIGRQATAVTALVPTGFVELDGRRYEAFARHGHTAVGERIEVVDVDNFRLIVSKPSTPPSS